MGGIKVGIYSLIFKQALLPFMICLTIKAYALSTDSTCSGKTETNEMKNKAAINISGQTNTI